MVVYAIAEKRRRDVLNDLPALFIPADVNIEPLRVPPPAAEPPPKRRWAAGALTPTESVSPPAVSEVAVEPPLGFYIRWLLRESLTLPAGVRNHWLGMVQS